MTEDEWLSSVRPGPMFGWLEANLNVTQRKKRLFVCAACRLGEEAIRSEVLRLLEAAEDFADQPLVEHINPSNRSRFHDALLSLWRVALTRHEGTVVQLASYAFHGVGKILACLGEVADLGPAASPQALADLVRELFGDPYRKARWVGARLRGRIDTWPSDQQPGDLLLVRDWLRWHHGVVADLARSAYDERDWEHLPVLADALEDAGCSEPALLDHLRSGGPHYRGCWALDLILGKD